MKNLLTFIVLGWFTSCWAIANPVELSTEERQHKSFHSLEVHHAVQVFVSRGKSKITIKAESSMLNKILTEVKNGVLKISLANEARKFGEVKVYVSAEKLNGIEVYSAAVVNFKETFAAENFQIQMAGASRAHVLIHCERQLRVDARGATTLQLQGRAEVAQIDLRGAARTLAYDLDVRNMQLSASGAAHASVMVSGNLNVNASGAGRVSYQGNPKVFEESTSGAAAIVAAN